MTASLLKPWQRQIAVLAGGTNAWIQAGSPIITRKKTRWSLERQVRLGAGLLVLFGATLALTANTRRLLLAAFVGLGLSFAGLTDICPMAEILGPMPWKAKTRCKSNVPNLELSKGA